MRDQDNQDVAQFEAKRALMISPDPNEVFRRNRSRIFVWPEGEAVITTMLFQGQRPIEQYQQAVLEAIQSAGLALPDASDISLVARHDPNFAGGMMTSYFETSGWLYRDEDGKQIIYDMAIEVSSTNEVIGQKGDFRIFNGDPVEGKGAPLFIVVDSEQLLPQVFTGDIKEPDTSNVVQLEVPGNQAAGNASNSEQPQRAAARQPQDEGGQASGSQPKPKHGRVPGQPGRVKDPDLDGRLKANRRNPQEGSKDDSSPRSASGGGQ